MNLNNKTVKFVVDTGCPVTLISEEEGLLVDESSKKIADCRLSSYTGHKINIIGVYNVRVNYKNQDHELTVHIVEGKAPALLGRSWMEKIQLNWNEIMQ